VTEVGDDLLRFADYVDKLAISLAEVTKSELGGLTGILTCIRHAVWDAEKLGRMSLKIDCPRFSFLPQYHATSNRSWSITLLQAATKSFTNFSFESEDA
jgi:hypothetical protein